MLYFNIVLIKIYLMYIINKKIFEINAQTSDNHKLIWKYLRIKTKIFKFVLYFSKNVIIVGNNKVRIYKK